MIGGAGALALLFFFVVLPILRAPAPAKDPKLENAGPVAQVEPAIAKFIEDVKASGQRPPRILEPRASSILRQATDRARLTEISNPIRLRSACLNAEALLSVYRKGRNPADKTNPNVIGPNGAITAYDPYYVEEVGMLAGFVVRCLGAQIAAMERQIDVAGITALDNGQRGLVRELKLSATAAFENLFVSAIPDNHAPEYRTYGQYSDAVFEYAIVFNRVLAPQEREKLLDKTAKFIERVPPYLRETALRLPRTFSSSECIRMCKLPPAK